MKTISEFLLVMVFFIISMIEPIHAQIIGKVIDSNNEPIPYINVILYNATDTGIFKGVITNEQGLFSIKQETYGTYVLKISGLGYSTYNSESFTINENSNGFNFKTIVLNENVNELNEVVISSKKNLIQNTSTGKVINVQSSLMTKGSNTLQVLERLPGILLDKQNNDIILNGQNGVTIMINGRRMPMSTADLMDLLESTVADNIVKIELITSPTAKYDADGGAGIVNIILKRNETEGNQLNVNTSLGYGFKEKASTSFNYFYGKENIYLSASYSVLKDKSKNGFEGSGTSNMPILGGMSEADFSTYFNNNLTTHNLNLSLTNQINLKTEIGGELAYIFSKNHNISDINNSRYIVNHPFIRSEIISEGTSKKNNLISSLYLLSNVSDNSQLNFSLNYLAYSNNSPNEVISNYFNEGGETIIPENEIFTDGNRGESISKIKIGVIKADYSLKINEKTESEFGFKGSYTANKNNSKIETNVNGIWEIDPRSQSTLESNEKLWALYTQFKFLINKKSTISTGLRYENWRRDLTNKEKPFVIKELFPSFLYNYSISDESNLSLNYNRRISRPTYEDLVTNLFYNDPTAVFTGNPLLKPTIINTLKLEYAKKEFNIGVTAQNEINPIIRYQLTTTQENNILLISPQNAEYQRSLNFFLNFPIKWANWAKLNISSTTAFRKYKISYSPSVAEKAYVSQALNFNQNIKLSSNMDIELSGWRNFGGYSGTNKNKGFGVLNFGISKRFNSNKGTIQFTITDLLKSFNVRTHISGMTPIIFDINTKSNYRDEGGLSRIFRLTYSRSFGNISTTKNRNSSVQEERERGN